jgi:hypothetical protein
LDSLAEGDLAFLKQACQGVVLRQAADHLRQQSKCCLVFRFNRCLPGCPFPGSVHIFNLSAEFFQRGAFLGQAAFQFLNKASIDGGVDLFYWAISGVGLYFSCAYCRQVVHLVTAVRRAVQ